MSRATKIVLGIIAGLLVVCLCVGVVAAISLRSAGSLLQNMGSMTEDPQKVAQIAGNISDYKLPAGYSEQFGMSFFGFDMVAFGPAKSAKNQQVMMLMQFPKSLNINQADMEKQLQQSLERRTGQQEINLKVVAQDKATIRDQAVTLTVREGADKDGRTMRQESGVFQGKNGPTLLMIMGDKTAWDTQRVNAFIASLR
jgi:hypothetical protein